MTWNGKLGVAPCGHSGEAIIGQYYRCLAGCDAVPTHVEPEKTKPLCRHCGSDNVKAHRPDAFIGVFECQDCKTLSWRD